MEKNNGKQQRIDLDIWDLVKRCVLHLFIVPQKERVG